MEMNDMRVLREYINGNYKVTIYEDGTKVRELLEGETEFMPVFPESIDLKITNDCNMGCDFCHEASFRGGKHGDIDLEFLKRLPYGMELALGGGNVFSHPNLMGLLVRLTDNGNIPNITVHQTHCKEKLGLIKDLMDHGYVYGLGISFNGNVEELGEILETLNSENVVLHVIAGLVTVSELAKISRLKRKPKVLILGYKNFRRGANYKRKFKDKIEYNIGSLSYNIARVVRVFDVVSFDNLALDQLEMKKKLTREAWEEMYMGEDGEFTMYVDLSEGEFACNSRTYTRYKLLGDIRDMFEVIRNEKGN